MSNTEHKHLSIRIFTNKISDIRGVSLPKGVSFVLSKKTSTVIVNEKDETCLIYLDNGGSHIEDWEQYVVNKSKMYDNSILL